MEQKVHEFLTVLVLLEVSGPFQDLSRTTFSICDNQTCANLHKRQEMSLLQFL